MLHLHFNILTYEIYNSHEFNADCLHFRGILLIAEVISRFDSVGVFVKKLKKVGFSVEELVSGSLALESQRLNIIANCKRK